MNTCTFIGRLVKDPDLKEKKDFSLYMVNIAIDRSYKGKDGVKKTDFIQVRFLSKHITDFIGKYVKKGQLVSIVASFQNNNYEKDGEMVYQNILMGRELTVLQWNKKEDSASEIELKETPF